jgi:hypothetical protein
MSEESDLIYYLALLSQHQSQTNGGENCFDARKSRQVQEESDEENIPPVKKITSTPKKLGVK